MNKLALKKTKANNEDGSIARGRHNRLHGSRNTKTERKEVETLNDYKGKATTRKKKEEIRCEEQKESEQ